MKRFFSDIRSYFLRRPAIDTRIPFATEEDREEYSHRVLQRLGLSVSQYSVLNLHKIGIDAPVSHVFEELLQQQQELPWWPNSVVSLDRQDGRWDEVEFFLFGGLRWFGYRLGRLFKMKVVRIRRVPEALDQDNARYVLYECSGGYPVGIFVMYARSGIEAQGEHERTQFFSGVGFNFYGRTDWRHPFAIVNRVWESIHNRVTANVLNTFKRECEADSRARLETVLQAPLPVDGQTFDEDRS